MIPPDDESSSVGEPSSGPGSQTDTSRDADVHAFLIADVRGYTAFTQERGDEDAGRLAGRFAQVTRAVVEDHRGRVLELRGDEALVVFGSPRSAIRGAVALQQRYVEETVADPSLPLTVGIGLDAGEAVAVEGGYRGGALNVAARLCSLARAGEVLASREIVHLALRVDGVRFTERGQAELKGLDKPVHVVAVRSEERDDALAIAPFVRSIARPRTRWKAVAAVVAFVVVAALIAIPLVARRAGGNSEIEQNSVGVLDPESGDVVATVRLEEHPGSVATSADAVWVTNPDVDTVTRIEPNELEIRDSIPVGETPTGIAVGFGAVWVVNSGGKSVSRISPDTNEVVGEPIEVGNGPVGIAAGEDAVWVTNRFDGTISRIDSGTSEVKVIPVGLEPRGIAIGFDSLWVALAGSNQVVRINPKTNEVTQPISVGNAPGSLAVSPDAVWVANTLDDTVSEIDPDTNTVVGTTVVGDGPSGVAVVQGIVWVANEWDGTLSRIEPGQTSASPTVIGSVPQGLAGANGDLWVSVRGTATSHRGGTLRLVEGNQPNSLDPGNSYTYVAWQVLHLIHDGLVAFEPTGGDPRPVPDLAVAIPTPTDGGLTYSFQLRRGIQYSNGEVVAPADFLRAFERGWPHDPRSHQDLYGGLVGAEACGSDPHTCDLSEGIVTDDVLGTITFHLVAPDPEFVYKLAIPFAYPVPPSVPDEEQAAAGVPGTGPYMLEAPMTEEGLTLVRNPNFRVWSAEARPDGYVDRIEWAFGVKPKEQIEAVAAGEADFAFDPEDAPDTLEELFVRSPAQVYTSPAPLTLFAVLDTRVPPFDDVAVRRAMNFALDRDRIVQIFGGEAAAQATCQQLPPNFPGYKPYCPYTSNPGPGGEGSWSGPDMKEALRLVRHSDTAGSRVAVKFPPFFSDAAVRHLGDYMIELLDDLGYVGSVEQVDTVDEFYAPDLEFDMVFDAWAMDYPAASNFISNRFTCDTSYSPSAGFCDPQIDAKIDRATRMQIDDPAAAGPLWAEVDRAIVDQAPYVWLVNGIDVEFVSERVGNYQYSQQWGSGLLDQLWVR
jgi:YVTN family beta-propeller protein